jgi:hypothetical protein
MLKCRCICIATICGYFIKLSILYSCWFRRLTSWFSGINLCKSSHFVSVTLSVKNKVGEPSWFIMLVSSLRHVFQYDFVHQIFPPYHINLWANLVSRNSFNSLCKSYIVVGIPSSIFFFPNTIVVPWILCLIIIFKIK